MDTAQPLTRAITQSEGQDQHSVMGALNGIGSLMLMQTYDMQVQQISLILTLSSVINLIGSPYPGRLLDRYGERIVLTTSYALLTLGCVGFSISINHVTSVAMPLITGILLPVIGYSGVFLGTASLILLSIPPALGLQAPPKPVPQTAVVAGD